MVANKVRRKKKKKVVPENTETEGLITDGEEQAANQKAALPKTAGEGSRIRLKRYKAEAILVKGEADKPHSYADLFHKITEAADGKLTVLQAVRRARTGDLSIEISAKADIAPVHEMVERAIGDKERLRSLRQHLILEIRGLDPITGDMDLIEDLAKVLELEPCIMEARSIRLNGNAERRSGIFMIPARCAKNIKEGERIQMGYVMTRPRVLPDIIPCYECHHFAHIANQCKHMMDGKEICRRCGSGKHVMATCKAQVRCLLCDKAKLPLNRLGHVAGSITCPQYTEALGLIISRTRV